MRVKLIFPSELLLRPSQLLIQATVSHIHNSALASLIVTAASRRPPLGLVNAKLNVHPRNIPSKLLFSLTIHRLLRASSCRKYSVFFPTQKYSKFFLKIYCQFFLSKFLFFFSTLVDAKASPLLFIDPSGLFTAQHLALRARA